MGTRPLEGLKVVDLTRYVAGPFATQILGDYGAEVWKIEPVKSDPREALNRSGYFFLSVNRSKKSVALNWRDPRGRAVLDRLLARADVLVDNFRPGVMEALGLSHEALAPRNPRLITCSISGFGPTGPMRNYPGFDQIAQGMSGLMSVTGTKESGPTRMGVAICDLLAGIFAAQGILLALVARNRTGRGQHVDTSLLESGLSILSWSAGIYFESGAAPEPQGNHHPLVAPHGVFQAADRPFNIAVGNEAMWRKFTKAIGRPDLETDVRFADAKSRLQNRAALNDEVNRALATRPASDWIELLIREGIPAGPILNVAEALTHPQALAREMLLELQHPELGTYKTTGLAVKLHETPGNPARPPLLGEHTQEVLSSVGYSHEELAQLKEQKVIA